jgi:hypothetical protein
VACSKYTDATRRRGLPKISKIGDPQLLYLSIYRRGAGTERSYLRITWSKEGLRVSMKGKWPGV